MSIKNNILDDVTETNDALLDTAENAAIDLAKGYLNARYDCDALFALSGGNRPAQLVSACVDIALYKLHSRINPRKIPEMRKQNYDVAIKWLEDVRDGMNNPPGYPVLNTGEKDYVIFGGNKKRSNHIQTGSSPTALNYGN